MSSRFYKIIINKDHPLWNSNCPKFTRCQVLVVERGPLPLRECVIAQFYGHDAERHAALAYPDLRVEC